MLVLRREQAYKMADLKTVFCKNLFAGKVAIVTGGGTGIGKAITSELARLGCRVVIAARKLDRLQEAAREINHEVAELERGGAGGMTSLPDRVYPYQCNIRKEEQVEALMKHTVDNHGRIDYLVNNGGGQFPSPFSQMSTKGWNAVIDTNLNGTYYCLKHAYKQWMGEHGGAIVNIILVIWKGFPLSSHSGAARAGVDNLTKSLAIEWAADNIRINCISPGTIYSETAANNYPPGSLEGQRENIPAGRLGHVEEVSAAVCFLLSPGAAYITGSCVKVDGGSSLYLNQMTIPDREGFPELLHHKTPLPPRAKL